MHDQILTKVCIYVVNLLVRGALIRIVTLIQAVIDLLRQSNNMKSWRRSLIMKVEVKEVDNVKVIKLTGQIRISTQNEFKDLLDNAAKENEGKPVIISMDGVIYMNSAGLGIIIDTYKKFKEKGGRMILCNLTPDITKLFQVTRLDRFIEIYETENEALATL